MFSGIPMPTSKDSDQYNMNHRRRGRAFVFNHMNFDPRLNLNVRNGTNNDRDNLRINLRQLDFDVEVHDDLPFKDIERILENASLEDHSDADCILVAVLSHGELGPWLKCDFFGDQKDDPKPNVSGLDMGQPIYSLHHCFNLWARYPLFKRSAI